ncbi:MAG TPA: GspH/FimT family pseudopilin [Steroidobacteraceae bacterium]|nr:GspH/FimT family pseudopilin [Steroidobacteraceae bacterium]
MGPHTMRGFTLIELITCIIVLGLLAALAGPRFFDTQPFNQRGYVDELSAALRYAEGVAVASGCNVQVTVTRAGYSAMQRAAAGNTCAAAGAYTTQVVRADGSALSGTPPTNANVTAGGTIVFNSSGGVANPPPPSLVVGSFTLSVDPVSGFVTVQ